MDSIISIFADYFVETFLNEGLFIVVVAFVLGDLIKKVSPINNQYIPAIIAVVSALVAAFTPFVTGDIVVKIFKGIVLGWAATGGYETLRNIVTLVKTKKNEDSTTDTTE